MEYFITGIDTDIGKTFVTQGLALGYHNAGKKVGVFKPLQSGAIKTDNGFLAPDLESVKKLSPDIATKCSYLLEGEVSPALAAKLAGVKIDKNKIISDLKKFASENDVTIVEGAGGILAPATEDMLCADLIKMLNIPIIIVTVPFLGRLNHTLLTVHYAKTHNIPIKGIVINKIPVSTSDDATLNFESELCSYTDVPVIAKIKEMKNPSSEQIINAFSLFL